jgi:hypothetical protein
MDSLICRVDMESLVPTWQREVPLETSGALKDRQEALTWLISQVLGQESDCRHQVFAGAGSFSITGENGALEKVQTFIQGNSPLAGMIYLQRDDQEQAA